MKRYPSVPHAEDSPALFDGGHLWVQELLDGAHLRFRMEPSGALRFGDRERVFRDGGVPLAYDHAVRHVRESLDRAALRAAVDDVGSVVFFAEAMHRQAVAYDWHRTPSVLGVDVWDEDSGRFLPPDAVEQIFERLGLEPVNTFEKEVRAADFQPESATFPQSAWREGPAAGLFLRNKTGGRARLPNPAVELDADPEPLTGEAEVLAARYADDERLRRVAETVDSREGAVTFESLFDRAFESILRETHARLDHGQTTLDVGEFRSAVAARCRAWLAEQE
ncbi:hypothetical protein HWV07_03645 [Natronomonas salina]|uniref:RNA ligase family protein n=1 Tax=Natronomonas salina TaxID=1710540 RepID=UPI0015B65161|nr:RNA ligase family protein [Natronomonas salina]QLD88175.1 hypothetical protein HWV07_03645 [Natronomonas salina]